MKRISAAILSMFLIFLLAATTFAEPAPLPQPDDSAAVIEFPTLPAGENALQPPAPSAPAPTAPAQQTQEATETLARGTTAAMKPSAFASNTSLTTRPQDEGKIYVGYAVTDGVLDAENSNWTGNPANLVLGSAVTGEGFTAVRAAGAGNTYVTGKLELTDSSDGQTASDFTGVGAAIAVSDGANVVAYDTDYYSEGFVRAFAVIDNASMVIQNSEILALGKNPLTDAYDGYYNSANTSMMISPPWVLGIQGGIRAVNVLGEGSSLIVADSQISTGGWGVISTDGCQSPYLWLYNSTLNILPGSAAAGCMDSGWKILGYDIDAYGSGYGSYIIGDAQEYFYGMTINGATYGSILTGGDAWYQGLERGKTYTATLGAPAEEGAEPEGKVLGTYTAQSDENTVINTVFGFMAHNSGSINVLDGTVVNTAEATCLYKSGDVVWNFDGARLYPGNGIIFQMIDNDDTTVGGFDPFGTYLVEEAGFPMEGYVPEEGEEGESPEGQAPEGESPEGQAPEGESPEGQAPEGESPEGESAGGPGGPGAGGPNSVELNLENSSYGGDIFNATGYYKQAGDALTVNIGEAASLRGDIALTSHVHGLWLNDRTVLTVAAAIDEANAKHALVDGYYAAADPIEYVFLDENGQITENREQAVALQFTKFSTLEYFLLGHVLNMVHNNGQATVDVNVEGTWQVKSESLVNSLTIAETGRVFGELKELEDGTLLLLPSEEQLEPGTYGTVAAEQE